MNYNLIAIDRENFKEYYNTTGIYGIVNTAKPSKHCPLGMIYVGQAWFDKTNRAIGRRLEDHIYSLSKEEKPKYVNQYLWRSWHFHGMEVFKFVLIEIVNDKSLLTGRENYWVDEFHSNEYEYGYNQRIVADSNAGAVFKPISENELIEWIVKDIEKYGKTPSYADSTKVCEWSNNSDTWHAISAALNTGTRGLPKYSSLGAFMAQKLNIINRTNQPDLTIEIIVKWIKTHKEITGEFPTQLSGFVDGAKEDGYGDYLTWNAIYQALQNDLRGLTDRVSLAELIAQEFGVINRTNKPLYTLKIIKKWIKQHIEKYSKYPTTTTGVVEFALEDGFGEFTWNTLSKAMTDGYNGLKSGLSLADFIVKEFDEPVKRKGLRLTNEVVLQWAEEYFDKHGRYPTEKNEVIEFAERDGYYPSTWKVIGVHLRNNRAGLSYGKGLVDFIQEFSRYPQYTFEQAKEAVKTLQLKTRQDYRAYYKKDYRLPSMPERAYSQQWQGWKDFLGISPAKIVLQVKSNINLK